MHEPTESATHNSRAPGSGAEDPRRFAPAFGLQPVVPSEVFKDQLQEFIAAPPRCCDAQFGIHCAPTRERVPRKFKESPVKIRDGIIAERIGFGVKPERAEALRCDAQTVIEDVGDAPRAVARRPEVCGKWMPFQTVGAVEVARGTAENRTGDVEECEEE